MDEHDIPIDIEREVLADLLNLAGDEFINHGCNDFELPNTDAFWAFYVKITQWSIDETPASRPSGDKLYFRDDVLFRYFEAVLRKKL